MTEKCFTITRTFAAPRDLVWQAWTDPTIAVRWWHPSGFTSKDVQVELREGGTYSYVMIAPNGSEIPTGGRYVAVREPEHLTFTWGDPEDGDAAPVISVDLTALDEERTEMVFTLTGFANDSGTEHSVHDGWSEAFDELDGVLSLAPAATGATKDGGQ